MALAVRAHRSIGLAELMTKRQDADRAPQTGAKPPRGSDRRNTLRRTADLERRLAEMEEHVRASRRELDLQFQRMAQIQVDLDLLMKLVRGTPARSAAGGR
jgi:hypothetical protein